MRKAFLAALSIVLGVTSVGAVARAGRFLQSESAVIRSPAGDAVVRGTVPIVGTAVDPGFWKYEVYYAPQGTQQWVLIGPIHENQVMDGLLATWETTIVADGGYDLRLRVVNQTGNYKEAFVRGIVVANAMPTDTPEPTVTATPTATITPAATPTFIIPTSPLAQPTATPTLARPTRSALPDALDVGSWRQSLCLGAELMVLVILAIGVVFLVRRMI